MLKFRPFRPQILLLSTKALEMSIQNTPEEADKPPIAGSWNRLYAFVLLLHVAIIAALYLFTQVHS